MDPNALLVQIIEDLEDLNDDGENRVEKKKEIIYKLRTLAAWLEDGGFPPDIVKVMEDAGYERTP